MVQMSKMAMMAAILKVFNQLLSGVSTQKQSSSLLAHEHSTFWNLTLAVYVPFIG